MPQLNWSINVEPKDLDILCSVASKSGIKIEAKEIKIPQTSSQWERMYEWFEVHSEDPLKLCQEYYSKVHGKECRLQVLEMFTE